MNAEIGRKDSHWNKEAPSQKFLRGREGSAEENKDKEEEEEEGKMAVEKEEGEDGVEAVDMAEVRNFWEKTFSRQETNVLLCRRKKKTTVQARS